MYAIRSYYVLEVADVLDDDQVVVVRPVLEGGTGDAQVKGDGMVVGRSI